MSRQPFSFGIAFFPRRQLLSDLFIGSFVVLFMLLPFLGCPTEDADDGDDSEVDSIEIADQEAQGETAEGSWSFGHGDANDAPGDADSFWIELHSDMSLEEQCGSFGGFPEEVTTKILLTIPKDASGTTRLSLTENATFSIWDPEANDGDGRFENLVSTDGAVRIDEITDSTITGAILARYEDYQIEGDFTAEICDAPPSEEEACLSDSEDFFREAHTEYVDCAAENCCSEISNCVGFQAPEGIDMNDFSDCRDFNLCLRTSDFTPEAFETCKTNLGGRDTTLIDSIMQCLFSECVE